MPEVSLSTRTNARAAVGTSFQPRGAPEKFGIEQNLKKACLHEIRKRSPIVERNESKCVNKAVRIKNKMDWSCWRRPNQPSIQASLLRV